MTNKLVKLGLVTVLGLQLTLTTAYAATGSNIRIHNVNESKKLIVEENYGKLELKQEWYGYRFELGTNSSSKATTKMKTVDTREYKKALEAVKFDINIIGQYDVYFLDQRLTDYSNIMALSFMDDSAVVFGTPRKLTVQKTHMLAVHELGHQVDFKLMNDKKWDEYKEIRGIENFDNNSANYNERPQEIFAEDFRMIMGGNLAAKTPHINRNLENPNKNKELVEFFKELLEVK